MKKMKTAKVSIIIPVFNRADVVKDAVMSVLLQTYEDIELVVVNDGSTDHTGQILGILKRKWPRTITILEQKNAGPGPARQLGTSISKGDFIQYLDSDDILLDRKFELQVALLTQRTDTDICYGISYQEDHRFSPPIKIGPIRETGNNVTYLFPRLLNSRWWTTSCPLYRRELINSIGPWRDLINEEDWEFDARAGRVNKRLSWVPHTVSIRRINIRNDHLSYEGMTNPRKLSDRIIAKRIIFQCAVDAEVSKKGPEMDRFVKECLILARQTGALGLVEDSKAMILLGQEANEKRGFLYIVLKCYSFLGHLIGWNKTAKLSKRLGAIIGR